jgi:hypothetical protein
MKKTSLALFVSLLSLAGASFAQSGEIRESTDPDKIRAIEQHAEELKARGHNPSAEMSSGASGGEQAAHPNKAKKHQKAKKSHKASKAKKESDEAAGSSGTSGTSAGASGGGAESSSKDQGAAGAGSGK